MNFKLTRNRGAVRSEPAHSMMRFDRYFVEPFQMLNPESWKPNVVVTAKCMDSRAQQPAGV